MGREVLSLFPLVKWGTVAPLVQVTWDLSDSFPISVTTAPVQWRIPVEARNVVLMEGGLNMRSSHTMT